MSSPDQTALERVEEEVDLMAQQLEEPQWRTSAYQMVEGALSLYLSKGDKSALNTALETMRLSLNQAAASYEQSEIPDDEVTAESVASHDALTDGIEEWMACLDALEDPETLKSRALCDGALAMAEAGNRLLVAVQLYNERLQRTVDPFSDW